MDKATACNFGSDEKYACEAICFASPPMVVRFCGNFDRKFYYDFSRYLYLPKLFLVYPYHSLTKVAFQLMFSQL